MFFVRPVRPQDARRVIAAGLRRVDAFTLDTFTPAWVRPRRER